MSIFGILFLFSIVLLPCHFSSNCLSTDARAEAPCSYRGKAFCERIKEKKFNLQQSIQALNDSNPACVSLLISYVCTTCHEFTAKDYNRESDPRDASLLCSPLLTMRSIHYLENSLTIVCMKIREMCRNVSLLNTLFGTSKNLDQSQSGRGSHKAFHRNLDEASHLNDNNLKTSRPQNGLCLEKIGNGAYISMVPHPDGSDRIFVSSQQGKVWLADIPKAQSNGILGIVESEPFIDLTDAVASDTESGLMGMAFHPNFVKNGRLFMSFNCDKLKQPGCLGRCSCNTDVDCDPSKLGDDEGVHPCQYHTVVAEYSVNDTASKPSLAKKANPVEVRRIFTMGLPYGSGHAGQILFGPTDGYLYIMTADGSHRHDPYNFAQNKNSLLGKILRVDVDHLPSVMVISKLGLWGNYSIPEDNPYVDDKELEPEVWAVGFRNPWRCSFDSKRPSYFLCGDSGQDRYEEVDFIIKGGNYGWPVYEGSMIFHPNKTLRANTSTTSIKSVFPVMGYYHSQIDTSIGSASIIGGYFYRSVTDPCMYGRYLFMDLYGGPLFAGIEKPENSGNFTTSNIPYGCADNSPIQCSFLSGNPQPNLGYIFSFSEDNRRDLYILTSTGVYRVARPSRCNFTCSREHFEAMREESSSPPCKSSPKNSELLFSFFSILLFVLDVIM